MKKIFAAFIVSMCLLAGCTKNGFLEQTQTTNLNEETVFGDSTNSSNFLNQIYANIRFAASPSRFNGQAGLEAACDEAEGPAANVSTTYNQFAIGSVSAYSISTDAWNTPYTQIRAVNQFLKHLDSIPGYTEGLKIRSKGEAMFLRAWYYFIMLEHYGGVPLLGDTVYNATDKVNTVRNTFEECVNYITGQCDLAAEYLAPRYTAEDFGRATKGACLALKAKALLYAASPLFNGGQIATAEPLRSITGYPSPSNERWQKAADAAKAVIDLGVYSLSNDTTKPSVAASDISGGWGFYNLFFKRVNSEYILQFMPKQNGGFNNDLEGLWRPPTRGGSNTSGSWPYHNLVAAFQMNNGKDITDLTSGYNPNNPYKSRDPRFYFTVNYNGDSIILADNIFSQDYAGVYTYVGFQQTVDAFGVGTPTGYYVNKMCSDAVSTNTFGPDGRSFPLMRLADIYLMYAEALNEVSPGSPDVYKYVDSVRYRAGMPNLPAGLSQEAMREAIHHERQVELAFEAQRFFDVRRWKEAEETQKKAMTGMKITRDASENYTYNIVDVRDHRFTPNMYLWPIPQSETAKSPDLLQNQGY